MTTFDVQAYWLQRGKVYEAAFPNSPKYLAQEQALAAVLEPLPFHTVLEVGCGFGRIGQLVQALRPSALYSGVDISPDQVAAAARRLPDANLLVTPFLDFDTDRQWDLVLAVEFLMHVPPEQLGATMAKLGRLTAGHLVTLDWNQPIDSEVSPHNWCHDYTRWFGAPVAQVGDSGIYHAG